MGWAELWGNGLQGAGTPELIVVILNAVLLGASHSHDFVGDPVQNSHCDQSYETRDPRCVATGQSSLSLQSQREITRAHSSPVRLTNLL